MSIDQKIREFIERVLPWPTEDCGKYTGFINLHWMIPNKDPKKNGGKPFWIGRPVQTIDGFFKQLAYVQRQRSTLDVYFCTSLQSQTTVNKKGQPKAVKGSTLALKWKAIWLDLDVETPGIKKDKDEYKDKIELMMDLAKFIAHFKLPQPSALINSGGGVQVYWISKTPLTLEEWLPYSTSLAYAAKQFGLKCDTGCTTDRARVLRMPGTFNHKVLPLRPVTVMGLGQDYDFIPDLSTLPLVEPVTATVKPKADLSHLGKPSSLFDGMGPIESLSEGLHNEYPPLDPTLIIKDCAFFREALRTGGKDYSNPLWNYTTLGATFMENGRVFAHGFANKHKGYSIGDTDALFDRKIRERDQKGLGWPRCSTIHREGFGGCATCPLLKLGKSPLNLGTQRNPSALPVTSSTAVIARETGFSIPTTEELELPPGYVCVDGVINAIVKVKDDEYNQPLFQKIIFKQFASRDPDALNFTTTLSKGHVGRVTITKKDIALDHVLKQRLFDQGALPEPTGWPYVWSFIVSWLGKLELLREAQKSAPFGWIEDDGGKHGFAYGGQVFMEDGTITPSGISDPELKAAYSPMGSKQVWIDASKVVTNRKRPDLDVILASGFAAPLMSMANQPAILICAFGNESGRGKSSARKAAMAVWGDPSYMDVKDSTVKSILGKIGRLRNIPTYWDEVDEIMLKNVYKLLTTFSEGKEQGRMNSDRSLAERGSWKTVLTVCSNYSFVDVVVRKSGNTSAGMYRVFEYEVPSSVELPDEPGRIDIQDADKLFAKLSFNYGQVGLEYAKFLGTNAVAIDAFVRQIGNELSAELQIKDNERYWLAGLKVLIAGAHYANQFGAEIDIPAMRKFLVDKFYVNRQRVTREDLESKTDDRVNEALTMFLSMYRPNTLWTDVYHKGSGHKTKVERLGGPPRDQQRAIYVHFAVEERKLRFSRRLFHEMLDAKGFPSGNVLTGLHQYFIVQDVKAIIGSGVQDVVGAQQRMYQIEIPVGSSLEDSMMAYSHTVANEMREAITAMAPIEPMKIKINKDLGISQAAIDQAASDLKRAET